MTNMPFYLMESDREAFRLDIKTDPKTVIAQAHWCGIKPGLRVLDVGCGPGKTTSIIHEMVGPGGSVVGLDFSEQRIEKARQKYGSQRGIDFRICNFVEPVSGLDDFDIVWVRFVLEYYAEQSINIVRNIGDCLKPGGVICLIDLDHNSMNHYELSSDMENALAQIMTILSEEYNFDPYAGRKLYSYLFDMGYENIEMDLRAHHLIYGKSHPVDLLNWFRKLKMASVKATEAFDLYPGGRDRFFEDFVSFFENPRRFTYTPLILCKGRKPR